MAGVLLALHLRRGLDLVRQDTQAPAPSRTCGSELRVVRGVCFGPRPPLPFCLFGVPDRRPGGTGRLWISGKPRGVSRTSLSWLSTCGSWPGWCWNRTAGSVSLNSTSSEVAAAVRTAKRLRVSRIDVPHPDRRRSGRRGPKSTRRPRIGPGRGPGPPHAIPTSSMTSFERSTSNSFPLARSWARRSTSWLRCPRTDRSARRRSRSIPASRRWRPSDPVA